MSLAESTASSAASFQMADHRTPLVRNCWYMGALASEVGRTLMVRRVLGTPVLFYRTEAGLPVAMDNRCVHRSFPLDKGRLEGDCVRCGYHGMRFDASGQCVEMPSLRRAPGHAKQRSYPVRERGPVVWIWMGDAAKADDSLIVDLPWLDSDAWRTVSGSAEVDANYVAMHENLLDHTHFPVLHGDAVSTEEYINSVLKVRQEGNKVFMTRELPDSPVAAGFGHIMGIPGRRVDSYSDSCFESPALHVSHSRFVESAPQGEARPFHFNITHVFTPAQQNSIHYWWFFSRDFQLDNPEIDGVLAAGINKAFTEDKDALSWIQAIKDEAVEPLPELSFAPDRPGMLMRSVLLRLANEESKYSANPS